MMPWLIALLVSSGLIYMAAIIVLMMR